MECAKSDSKHLDSDKDSQRKRAMLPPRTLVTRICPSKRGGDFTRWERGMSTFRYPERKMANVALNNAVRDGRIEKKHCEVCGANKSRGHHVPMLQP